VPQCKRIIESLGFRPQRGGQYRDDNSGCSYHPGQTGWYQVLLKNCEPECSAVNADSARQRVCACEYFLAPGGLSCTQACAARGATCHAEALSAAASSVPQCKRIIESLGFRPQRGGQYRDDNSGCSYHPGQTGWYQVLLKNCEPECSAVNADSARQRVCACGVEGGGQVRPYANLSAGNHT